MIVRLFSMFVFLLQGAQNESFPYVYYTPTYGYAESPYNPYNPYMHGAFIRVNGQFIGDQAQQYYSFPHYQNVASSSPAYAPIVVQPDIVPHSSPEAMLDTESLINRSDRRGLKNNLGFTAGVFQSSTKPASYQKYSLTRVPEGTRSAGTNRQVSLHGNVSSGSLSSPVPSHVHQVMHFCFIYFVTCFFFGVDKVLYLLRMLSC